MDTCTIQPQVGNKVLTLSTRSINIQTLTSTLSVDPKWSPIQEMSWPNVA